MRALVAAWIGAISMFAADGAHAACTFGTSPETSLQGVFDSTLGAGALDATNGCVLADNDQVWTAQGEVAATILVEIAGFANQNVFGIYDPVQPTGVSVFSGAQSTGATATIQLVANNSKYDVVVNGIVRSQFTTPNFGFYLLTPQQNVFYSQPSLNADRADHMYSYRGNGGTFVSGPLLGSQFTSQMYLLAFEDLPIPAGDEDFQDFVALVNYAPVPLPAGGWLLGSVLALFVVLRRRLVTAP